MSTDKYPSIFSKSNGDYCKHLHQSNASESICWIISPLIHVISLSKDGSHREKQEHQLINV